MTVKQRMIKSMITIWWSNHRSRKIAKKIERPNGDEKYPSQWRNDYVLKKTKRMLKKLNVTLEVKGWNKLPKAPAVIVPNHQSAFDPGFIIAALENPSKATEDFNIQSVFIAKDELKKDKRSKGWLGILNTFFIKRNNPRQAVKTLDEFAQYAKDTRKMAVIFPEGTRTKDGNLQEFKGGAFRVAKKMYTPIVPVTINNAFATDDMSRKETLKVEVIFHKPIKPISFISMDTKSIASKVEKQVKSSWVKPTPRLS